MPEQAHSRATLGVFDMTRVELLRDLYVWAYERSTQEYLAIKQDLAEPDPLRLAWRDLIKQTIREVITHPELEPLSSEVRQQRAIFRDFGEISSLQINGLGHFLTPN